MKNIIVCIVFIALSYSSIFSQCSFELNEVDKFTKASKIETKSENLFKDFSSALSIKFCKYDTTFFLRIGLNLTSQTYGIAKGGKLMFICGDSVITILSDEVKVATGYTTINYSISEEQLKTLKSINISEFRLYLVDSFFEGKVELKKAEKIKLISNCI
jgi:hypothetical protein